VQAAHQADLEGEFAAALDALTGPGSARELVIGARSARLPDIRSLAGDLRRAWTKQTATATTLLGVRSQALRLLRPPSLRHRRHSGLMVVAMGPQRSGATPVLRAVGTTFPIPSRHVCMTGWTMRRHDPQLRPGAHDASPARLVMMLAAALTVLYHVRRGRLVLLEKVTYDSAGSSPATAVLSRIVEWVSPSGFRADVLVVLQAPDQQGGQPSPAPAPPGTSLCLLDATLPPAELHRRVTDCVWQRFLQPAG